MTKYFQAGLVTIQETWRQVKFMLWPDNKELDRKKKSDIQQYIFV